MNIWLIVAAVFYFLIQNGTIHLGGEGGTQGGSRRCAAQLPPLLPLPQRQASPSPPSRSALTRMPPGP
jgi:hypothetical protein